LRKRIAVRINQDVVDKLTEDVDLVFRPDDLVAPLEIFGRVFGPEPAM
jgi:hypothetical protein